MLVSLELTSEEVVDLVEELADAKARLLAKTQIEGERGHDVEELKARCSTLKKVLAQMSRRKL